MILNRFVDLFMPKVHFGFLGSIGGAVASTVVGGLLGGISGGSSNEQTKSSAPWIAQQPHLRNVFGEAQALYNKGTPEYYGGQLTPTVNQNLQASIANPHVQANQGFLDGTQNAMNTLAGGNNLAFDQSTMDAVTNNPHVQSQIDAVTRDVNQNARMQTAQNNMNAGFMGNVGSSSTGVQNALVQQGANNAIADASTSIRANAFNQGVGAGMQGAGNRLTNLGLQTQGNLAGLNAMYEQAQTNYQNQLGAGMTEYELDQNSITAELAKWDYNNNAAWDNLARYRQMVDGNYGGTSTATASKNVDPLQGAIGGALSGYGLWEKFK